MRQIASYSSDLT